MRTAAVLLWAGCLWSISRSILYLLWAASTWRRMLMLAVLALALSSCRTPEEVRRNHQ